MLRGEEAPHDAHARAQLGHRLVVSLVAGAALVAQQAAEAPAAARAFYTRPAVAALNGMRAWR
jgi:hypothetical protein